jgi:methylmalonyl-CoA carboxyltransferase large subunit
MTAVIDKTQMNEVSLALKNLQEQVVALQEKVARLEAVNAPAAVKVVAPVAPPAPVPVKEEISEEIMLVLAAAVAAFLGERAHIRVARMHTSPTWAQVGRVSIQASHILG